VHAPNRERYTVEVAPACVSHVVPSTPSSRGWLIWAASRARSSERIGVNEPYSTQTHEVWKSSSAKARSNINAPMSLQYHRTVETDFN
jgi:hypothetical protein